MLPAAGRPDQGQSLIIQKLADAVHSKKSKHSIPGKSREQTNKCLGPRKGAGLLLGTAYTIIEFHGIGRIVPDYAAQSISDFCPVFEALHSNLLKERSVGQDDRNESKKETKKPLQKLKTAVHGFKSFVDRFKALVHLVNQVVKAFIHRFKAFIHRFKAPVNGLKTGAHFFYEQAEIVLSDLGFRQVFLILLDAHQEVGQDHGSRLEFTTTDLNHRLPYPGAGFLRSEG